MHHDEYMNYALGCKAVSLEPFGVNNVAWPQELALAFLKDLEGSATAILGGDVYKKDDDRLVLTYVNWHCDRGRAESLIRYAGRSQRQAIEFVASQPSSLYFSFVLSSEETAGLPSK